MAVFRARGYGGTTLDALSEATGMQRPSLYAAFGDKRALFDRTIERFARRMDEATTAALQATKLAEALVTAMFAVVDLYAPVNGRGEGCLVFGVASVEAVEAPELAALLDGAIRRVDVKFERRLAAAVEAGELSEATDVATLARLLTAVVHTLSLRARAGTTRRALRALARRSVALLVEEVS